jgi:hypothetical protein
MNRFLARTLTILLVGLTVGLSADFAGAQSKEEIKFRQSLAKKLNGFAKRALKKGFPRQAKLVFLMVVSDYDPDSAVAHKALGRKKAGTAWQPVPGFKFPRNDKPDASAAKALRSDYKKLSKDLVRAHKDQARKYKKGGRTDMAQYHYRAILRFAPNDEDAKESLELVDVADGLSGTSMEYELYKRGVKIDEIIKKEAQRDYPVERLPDSDKHPILEKAQVDYISVKSEHFIIRGDFDEAVLKEAAVWSERCYRVIKVAYEGYEQLFLADTSKWRVTQYSFFKSTDTHDQIIKAHKALFSNPAEFKFILERHVGVALGGLQISPANGKQGVLDGSVRSVAHSFSVFSAAAMQEGIGHTFVGLLLRNNRRFLVDLKKQIGTQTEEEEIDEFNTDMDLWDNLAIELAWKKANVPAVQLPLINADKFDDPSRIKSWSFCHYLMLRDPTLLRRLDQCGKYKNVIDIEKNFTKNAGVSLEQLDKEWKDFFTGATPVMRSIRDKKDPMTAVSKDVKKWLKAINDIRKKTFRAAPVNWSASFSGRCRDHAHYLQQNKLSGPDEEQRQNPELPGSTHPGNMFAQMSMVHTKASNTKKVIAEWLTYPGYRDVFFVNTLKTIGLYAENGVVVLNVVQGLVRPRNARFFMYPQSGMTRIPNQVKVADLGPEMKVMLAKRGKSDLKVIGMPISGHFGNSLFMPNRDSIRCKVMVNDRDRVEGFVHFADDGSHRRTAAPGMMVFYPFKPIRKGAKVSVEWTFQNGPRLEKFKSTYHH